jgi:hypothetical protein
MTRFHVVVVEPTDDEEVMTSTLVVTANRLDYDDNGVLEMWQGPAEGERLVAVFAPQTWLRAYDAAQVSEPPED